MNVVLCRHCSKPLTPNRLGKYGKFCNRECMGKSMIKTKESKNCKKCGTMFYYSPNRSIIPIFCSRVCSYGHQYNENNKIVIKCKQCDTDFVVDRVQVEKYGAKYCSKTCQYNASKSVIHTKCAKCDIDIDVHLSRFNRYKKHFCSMKCKGNYGVEFRIRKNRSKAEDYLINLIRQDFKNIEIQPNNRSILDCKYEIDIWIPSIQLAIELNGPTHYINMYGNLDEVRNRDIIKSQEIISRGYKFIVMNINIPQKKVITLLNEEYSNVIKPLLSNLAI